MNYLELHDYRNAILLALSMEQPGRLHTLFKNLPGATDPSSARALSSMQCKDGLDEGMC